MSVLRTLAASKPASSGGGGTTVQTIVVDNTGAGDYTNLETAIESEGEDLVAATKIKRFLVKNTGLEYSASFIEIGNNYTTSSDYYIEVEGDVLNPIPAYSSLPCVNFNLLNYAFVLRNEKIVVSKLFIKKSNNDQFIYEPTTDTLFQYCVFEQTSINRSSYSGTYENCVFIARDFGGTDTDDLSGELRAVGTNCIVVYELNSGAYHGDISVHTGQYTNMFILNENARTTWGEGWVAQFNSVVTNKPASEWNPSGSSSINKYEIPQNTTAVSVFVDWANKDYRVNTSFYDANLAGRGVDSSDIASWARQ